jgi:hypothetical protein
MAAPGQTLRECDTSRAWQGMVRRQLGCTALARLLLIALQQV